MAECTLGHYIRLSATERLPVSPIRTLKDRGASSAGAVSTLTAFGCNGQKRSVFEVNSLKKLPSAGSSGMAGLLGVEFEPNTLFVWVPSTLMFLVYCT